jgi:hypothetical protein
LVVRLWIEPHDQLVRARLLTEGSDDSGGTVAIGVDAILGAVRDALHAFASGV